MGTPAERPRRGEPCGACTNTPPRAAAWAIRAAWSAAASSTWSPVTSSRKESGAIAPLDPLIDDDRGTAWAQPALNVTAWVAAALGHFTA